jgi:hypothetical protein
VTYSLPQLDSGTGPGNQNNESLPVKPKPLRNYFINNGNKTISIINILIKNLNLHKASEYTTSDEGLIFVISALTIVIRSDAFSL